MAKRRAHEEEHQNLERWLVSYADFITLLFAFFVVMYSISSINEGKYRVLSDSLVAAFQTPPKTLDPIQVGNPTKSVLAKESLAGRAQDVIPAPTPPISSPAVMEQIAQDVKQAMQPLIDQGLITVHQDKLWVEVEMNTSILFPSGSAELEDEAVPALRALADVLEPIPNPVHVEGYTDNVPIYNEVYPSNWELSAARAASVVHLLVDNAVDPGRLAAIGYGEHRPIDANDTLEGRRRNRRVVVVILSDPDAQRVLEIERKRRLGRAGESASGAAAGGV
ncbi:MAG: hypothetical protein AMJ69_06780 [Gammaproteobacteria bacterium SG8_47]|nr:MAG: hypothetical protein AMJ69_06780 [Gammaproteobacteria bacterium SG8_47]